MTRLYSPDTTSFQGFIPREWICATSYVNPKDPPKESGVYAITRVEQIDADKPPYRNFVVMYIGSSSVLYNRFKKHDILNVVQRIYENVDFYFRLCDNYLEEEKRLIQLYKPLLNKVHKNNR